MRLHNARTHTHTHTQLLQQSLDDRLKRLDQNLATNAASRAMSLSSAAGSSVRSSASSLADIRADKDARREQGDAQQDTHVHTAPGRLLTEQSLENAYRAGGEREGDRSGDRGDRDREVHGASHWLGRLPSEKLESRSSRDSPATFDSDSRDPTPSAAGDGVRLGGTRPSRGGVNSISSLYWEVEHGDDGDGAGEEREDNAGGVEGEETGFRGRESDEDGASEQGGEDEDGVGRYTLTADRLAALPVRLFPYLCLYVRLILSLSPPFPSLRALPLSKPPPPLPPAPSLSLPALLLSGRQSHNMHAQMHSDVCHAVPLQICQYLSTLTRAQP